mgnify:FL=1
MCVNSLVVILGGIAGRALPHKIMAIGVSVMIGDGLGMGVGDYLSAKSEKDSLWQNKRGSSGRCRTNLQLKKNKLWIFMSKTLTLKIKLSK